MHLTRKFQKAFDLDFFRSTFAHARRWFHPIDTRPMLAQLDTEAWKDLRCRYDRPRSSGGRDSDKFSDANYWLKVNVERAQDLGLNRSKPLRILDLGCGAGYFLFVSRTLGHEVLGLDVDDVPLYRETTRLLGVPRVIFQIEPYTPLTEFDVRFDLVTAHCICFQKIRRAEDEGWQFWGADEWRFFVQDVRTRVLTPAGHLVLDFNPRSGEPFYPPEVKSFFQSEGAEIFWSTVRLPAVPKAKHASTGHLHQSV